MAGWAGARRTDRHLPFQARTSVTTIDENVTLIRYCYIILLHPFLLLLNMFEKASVFSFKDILLPRH